MALQRNVQQQNAYSFEQLHKCALRYRKSGVAPVIATFLADKNIVIEQSAILYAEICPYILGYQHGFAALVVSAEGRFFELEIAINAEQTRINEVHSFSDVTSKQNVSGQNRGTGKGAGALGLAVLAALHGIPPELVSPK
jgi:predicted nucleic-acid-binding protein